MSKKILYFLLIFTNLIVFLNPPLVFAENISTCDTGVGPTQNPEFIQPGVTKEIKFTFTNLPKGKYYRLQTWWEKNWLEQDRGGGYFSDVSIEPDNTGSLTLTISEKNAKDVLNSSGTYKAVLQSGSKYENFCVFTYTVGSNFNYDSCIIDAPQTVQVGQDIIVNISNAPVKPITFLDPVTTIGEVLSNWEWPVYFQDKLITKVRITADGTASFVIPAYNYVASGELYLVHPPDKGLIINWVVPTSIIVSDRFCKTTLNIISSSEPVQPKCKINKTNPTTYSDVAITAVNLPKNETFWPVLSRDSTGIPNGPGQNSGDRGYVQLRLVPNEGEKLTAGNYRAVVVDKDNKPICEQSFSVGIPQAPVDLINIKRCGDPGVICPPSGGDPCDKNRTKNPGFKTAIGCIHTNPAEFVKDFLTFIIAISGGLAFLMMLLGVFGMLTSAGNPEALNAGRERLTSAIIGLLFVIFAILLMQIIGLDILRLPGFGR